MVHQRFSTTGSRTTDVAGPPTEEQARFQLAQDIERRFPAAPIPEPKRITAFKAIPGAFEEVAREPVPEKKPKTGFLEDAKRFRREIPAILPFIERKREKGIERVFKQMDSYLALHPEDRDLFRPTPFSDWAKDTVKKALQVQVGLLGLLPTPLRPVLGVKNIIDKAIDESLAKAGLPILARGEIKREKGEILSQLHDSIVVPIKESIRVLQMPPGKDKDDAWNIWAFNLKTSFINGMTLSLSGDIIRANGITFENGEMLFRGMPFGELTEAEQSGVIASELHGNVLGSVVTYAIMSPMLRVGLRSSPVLNKLFTKHSFIADVTILNAAEEAFDGTVRKASGQDYTFSDTVIGLFSGVVFETGVRGVVGVKGLAGAKVEATRELLNTRAKEFIQENGRPPSSIEFREMIGDENIPGTNVKIEDLHVALARSGIKEQRLIELRGGVEGRSGIERPEEPEVPRPEEVKPPTIERVEPEVRFRREEVERVLGKKPVPEPERVITKPKKIAKGEPIPEKIPPGGVDLPSHRKEVRKFIKTVEESEIVTPEVKKSLGESEKRFYTTITNKDTFDRAKNLVDTDIESATRKVNEALREGAEVSADDYATAQILSQKLQKEGKVTDGVRIIEDIAIKATKGGQAMQALGMWNRLTPEGALLSVQRNIDVEAQKKPRTIRKIKEKAANEFKKLLRASSDAEKRRILKKLFKSTNMNGKDVERFLDTLNRGDLTERDITEVLTDAKNLPRMTPDVVDKINDLIERMKKAPSDEEKAIRTAELQAFIESFNRPTLLRRISAIQTISMLLNPVTTLRNLIGNMGAIPSEGLANLVAVPIDATLSIITGKRTKVIPAIWRGELVGVPAFIKGAKRGVKEALRGVDTRATSVRYSGDISTGRSRRVFTDPFLGSLEKGLGIILRAPDRAFYERAFAISLENQMRAEKVEIPDDVIIQNANLDAMRAVFEEPSVLRDEFFIPIKRALNLGFEFGLGDVVLKFAGIPAVLIKRGMEFSPVGFLKVVNEGSKALRGKEFNQKVFAEALSRTIVGTSGHLALGYTLAAAGILTADADRDPDIRAVERVLGMGQYKLNVSAMYRYALTHNPNATKTRIGDILITYDWFQPSAMGVSWGANIFFENNKPEKQSVIARTQNFVDVALRSTIASVKTIENQPLLHGLRRFTGAGDSAIDGFANAIKDAPASFIPTLFNQINKFTDNVSRQTYDPSFVQEMLNRGIRKIPGLSKTLPARISPATGKPQTNYQDEGNTAINVFFSPWFATRVIGDQRLEEILRLYRETGDATAAPRKVKESITINGQKRILEANELQAYQEYVGVETKIYQDLIVASPEFAKLSDEDRINELAKILTYVDSAAKMQLFGHQPSRVSKGAMAILGNRIIRLQASGRGQRRFREQPGGIRPTKRFRSQ